MRKSKVLFSAVGGLCVFGMVNASHVQAKNIFTLNQSEEKPTIKVVQKKSPVKIQTFSAPTSAQAVTPAVKPAVMKKPAVSAAAFSGASINPAGNVSVKPQVGQIGEVDVPRLDAPEGAHIDKGKFEGMADHEGMRDHIPGIGDGGVHVAGKDGADAFTGRGDSGIIGADGNSIGISRSSGLTGADGNAIWDPSGGSSSSASAGTQMTDQYGRDFNRGEGGGSGKFITDPHTGESREIGGRGGSGSVSDSDRAAMMERNSIAGDNNSDSSVFGNPFKVREDTEVVAGMTIDEAHESFSAGGSRGFTLKTGPNERTEIFPYGSGDSKGLLLRVVNMSTWQVTMIRVEEGKTPDVSIKDDRVDPNTPVYPVGPIPDEPEEPEGTEDEEKPHPEDTEGRAHPDSLGDGGKAGKMHPDSVGGGGIASSEGVDSMGNPDEWFMPHPENVGGGGIASSEIADSKAGKPAGDSLGIGGLASSLGDASLRNLMASTAGKMHPENLGTGGIASSSSGVTVASSGSADAQVSAQVASKVDAVQLDAPMVETENFEGSGDLDNN